MRIFSKFKKSMALLLALVMLMGAFPMTASAEGDLTITEITEPEPIPENEPADDEEPGTEPGTEPTDDGQDNSDPANNEDPDDEEIVELFEFAMASTDITDDFTDPAFLAIVRAEVGKSGDDPILAEDVEDITELMAMVSGIRSLAGIQHFTALEKLDVRGNQLSTLDVSSNAALVDLDAHNNVLTSVTLRSATTYTKIDLRLNRLADTDAIINGSSIDWDDDGADSAFKFAPQRGAPAFTLSQTGTRTFTARPFGYTRAQAPAHRVTITNNSGTGNNTQPTGVLTVALSGDNASSFELSDTSIPSIAANRGTAIFTVEPKLDLMGGTHTATVTVSGGTGTDTLSRTFNVSFTVSRGPGAAVVGTPTVVGDPTLTAITVSALDVAAPNRGEQVIEYAIGRSTSTPGANAGWSTFDEPDPGDPIVFTGLTGATTYYVFARTRANANCNAGTVVRSLPISTERADGLAVVGLPTVRGVPTNSSITINAVTVATPNPSRQVVEYAITTDDSTTMPTTGLVWQTQTTFNNLLHDTEYFVWARSRANTAHDAGEAVRSAAAIKTAAGTNSIRLSRTDTFTFSAMAYGGRLPGPCTITINNTGTNPTGPLTIALSGTNNDDFTLVTTAVPAGGIARNGRANFTVQPKADLEPGRYTATVTVSGGQASPPVIQDFSATFNVSFTVNRAAGLAVSWPRNATPAIITDEITATKITIKDDAVTMAAGTGDQKIEYAITTSTAASAPANLVWQQFDDTDPIEFDGLQPSTRHFVWARSARNDNRDAGRAVRSVALDTSRPPIGIAVGSGRITNLVSHTFASADLGYTDGGRGRLALPPALSVVVRNVGTQGALGTVEVEFDGFDEDSFEILPNPFEGVINSLTDTVPFTVRPKEGLPGGLHQTRVIVSVDDAEVSFLVRFVVNRVAGAALTGTMSLDGEPTATTVTIQSTLAPATATGQAVEYAIATGTATRLPANLTWQTGLTFTGLNPETRYTVWARTASNASYNAGTAAQRLGDITTDRPDHRIQLENGFINRAGLLDMGSATYNTDPRNAQIRTITVFNSGTKKIDLLNITIEGIDKDAFVIVGNGDPIIDPKIEDLEPGRENTDEFDVMPVSGLEVGTYNATVKVSDGDAVTASFNVRFRVTRATSSATVQKPVALSRTATTITIDHHFPTPFELGQETEYAITTNAATRLPTNLVWQSFDSPPATAVFTGLQPATDYYVWARAKANLPNVAAGTALRSDVITTEAPEEALRLSITGPHTFAPAALRYGLRPALNVTVTNVGSDETTTDALTVEIEKISGADDAFVIVSPAGGALGTLEAGKSANFSIRPAPGNPGGTHTAKITVTDGAASDPLEVSFEVSFTVTRVNGSAVRAVPRATTVTNNTITVDAVEASTPANGQVVEYAISTGAATPTTGWQAGTSFTGLNPLTTYYVFARTAQSDSFNAGAVRRSAAIRTLAPEQGVSINRTGVQTFRAANWGYAAQAPLSVTITNIGAQAAADVEVTITRLDGSADAFVVSNDAWASIPVGGNRNFTIWPRTGLAGGTHRAEITIDGPGFDARSFIVQFTVNRVAGAAVSGAPVALSSTHNSITVAEVTRVGAAFGNDQVVEYAVSTTNRAPTTGWGTSTTITGLDPSTQYFVFARTEQNESHNAGVAQVGLSVQTKAAP